MKFFTVFILLLIFYGFVGQEIAGRIVDGTEVPIHAFPWMVSVRFHEQQTGRIYDVCDGSIISDIFIITAASCFFNNHMYFEMFSIKAGIHNIINGNEETEQVRPISHIIVHPKYNSSIFLNDLALVHVLSPFNFKTQSVETISLSNLTSVKNMKLETIGWDASNQSNLSVPTTFLQQVTVQENVECTKNKSIDSMTQLCATDTCLHDGGAPLMIYSKNSQQYELVGVTSYRTVCSTEGLFTLIAPFAEWILTILDRLSPRPLPRTTPVRITTTSITADRSTAFTCNTSYSCGRSSTPVIFHDESRFLSVYRRNQVRIVGGETAEPHSWPWIVSIRFLNRHHCGGALINNEWILTVAHCLLMSDYFTVHIGVHDVTLSSPQIYTIVEAIQHPYYVPSPKFISDIALLRLSSPINLTTLDNHIGVTCLPSQSTDLNYPKVGTRLSVIGWGKLVENGTPSNELHQVRVMKLANDDPRCIRASYDRERQFCAMVDGDGKGPCQGDRGSPIHQWLGNHWEQVGIVSFGVGCARENTPGVYTRLSVYRDWIQAIINGTMNTYSKLTPTSTSITMKKIDKTTSTSSKSTTTLTSTSETMTDDTTTITNSNAIVIESKMFLVLIICILLNFLLIY